MSDRLPRYAVDGSVRRVGAGGRLLVGGSPRRLFRLSPAGADLVDRLGDGERVAATTGRRALVDRLVGAGALHPEPDVADAPLRSDDVTVVVPVRDDAVALADLLASLRASPPRVARVIVVDDGSAAVDEVAAVVDGAAGSGHDVQLIRRERSGGAGVARNDGAAAARTRVLAFLDADCTVGPGWLDGLLAHLADPSVAIVAPRVVAAPAVAAGGQGWTAVLRYESHRSPLDLGTGSAPVAPGSRVPYVPSAAMVVRARHFERLGGFDPSLRVGEDVDLVWRTVGMGERVRYVASTTVEHRVRPDLGAWWRQRVGYGSSAAMLDRLHPGDVAPVVVSPWSAAVWALVLAGRPVVAGAVVVATTVGLRRELPDVPATEVVRLGVGGHLAAGRQLAHAVQRVWWPVALPAAAVSRRARRVVAAAVAVTAVDVLRSVHRDARAALVPPPAAPLLVVMALADDMAYGLGVWSGCRRARSIRALLPRTNGARGRRGGSERRVDNTRGPCAP